MSRSLATLLESLALPDQEAQAYLIIGLDAGRYDLSAYCHVVWSLINREQLPISLEHALCQLALPWRRNWKVWCREQGIDYPRTWRDDLPQELPSVRGRITKGKWAELCCYYGNRCLACGSRYQLTMDHIVPTSKGGSHDIDNIQPLCTTCNSRKCDQSYDYRPSGEVPYRRGNARRSRI